MPLISQNSYFFCSFGIRQTVDLYIISRCEEHPNIDFYELQLVEQSSEYGRNMDALEMKLKSYSPER